MNTIGRNVADVTMDSEGGRRCLKRGSGRAGVLICDAIAVHTEKTFERLVHLPEWLPASARLPRLVAWRSALHFSRVRGRPPFLLQHRPLLKSSPA
jgi:hypothetical protein